MNVKYISLLLLVVVLPVGCSNNHAADRTAGTQELSHELRPTLVKTAEIQFKAFTYYLEGSGKIMSSFQQTLLAGSAGIVEHCRAVNGAEVKRGEVLVRLSDAYLQLKREQARDQVVKTRIEFQSALLGYKGGEGMTDSLRRNLRAQSGLTTAELQLREIEMMISEHAIAAPISGRLANVMVRPGMQVKEGTELFTVYDHRDLYLEISVLEADLALVQNGLPARVTLLADNGKTYSAKVIEINPMVDQNGLITVKLKLLDSKGLLPGMNATARIDVPLRDALVVPKEAVVMRDGKPVVFTLRNGTAFWNYVETGRENGTEIEIRKGLSEKERVIVQNNLQLAHEAPVKETE